MTRIISPPIAEGIRINCIIIHIGVKSYSHIFHEVFPSILSKCFFIINGSTTQAHIMGRGINAINQMLEIKKSMKDSIQSFL